MDLRFYTHRLSCEAIVNGTPYWLLATPSNHCFRFTWFDVQNEAFVMLPGLVFSGFYIGTLVHWKLMDWKDNAAVVVLCPGNPFFDVWMIEDRCGGESNWCKKFVIGPVTPDVHFHEDLGLDSLDNMQIVMALEEEFKSSKTGNSTCKDEECCSQRKSLLDCIIIFT
ncbi:hypothetical protein HYC85_010665 [Camellia sinensis]|uniref:Acyl carrier protein n=1 Tax=Camellia sinensis TaxID=4442 RepID=A0A7J7HKF6_CAMSI|nr:hypothetical protein HYC85_010665 [Camellia sinensis]